MTGDLYFLEIVGSGAALFDYDNDGDLDAYLVQGNLIDKTRSIEDAIFPPPGPIPLSDRLFRNDLELTSSGQRRLRFTDVTEESGISATGYGMGVATGDYDRDGWVDLYITNWGPNQLYRNNGDGTFSDVTAHAGVDDPRWSVPALFFDFDGDGWLDLYVGNFIDFNQGTHRVCKDDFNEPDYCGPLSFRAEPDRLFRNLGNGAFEDVTVRAGMGGAVGNALGAVADDFNGDGWPDLYVANDQDANQMWINQRDGTMRDEAMLGGSAVNEKGQPEASMGVDAVDFDGDGDVDLFMTHLNRETNTLYVNNGDGLFDDASIETGVGIPSWETTGFGTAWLDFDNDGLLDLLVVNGRVHRGTPSGPEDLFPLGQPNQLFRHLGNAAYVEVSEQAGEGFSIAEVSRGAAVGDIDNDGDHDVLVTNNAGPARLLLNTVGNRNSWIGLRALSSSTGNDAVGARLEVFLEDGSVVWRRVKTWGSYASAGDPRILLGLGENRRVVKVRVFWPFSAAEDFTGLVSGEYNLLRQGMGSPAS